MQVHLHESRPYDGRWCDPTGEMGLLGSVKTQQVKRPVGEKPGM